MAIRKLSIGFLTLLVLTVYVEACWYDDCGQSSSSSFSESSSNSYNGQSSTNTRTSTTGNGRARAGASARSHRRFREYSGYGVNGRYGGSDVYRGYRGSEQGNWDHYGYSGKFGGARADANANANFNSNGSPSFWRVGEDADESVVNYAARSQRIPIVKESGTFDGSKGVYSESSSAVDSRGEGSYHVEAGKINFLH